MNPRAEFHESAGFGDGLIIDPYVARQNSSPPFLPAFDQLALQQ
jgi:hypothetical protein